MIALLSQIWWPLLGLFLAGLCLALAGLALHRARRKPAPPPPTIRIERHPTARCPYCRVLVLLREDGCLSRHLLPWTSTLCEGSGELAPKQAVQ